MTLCSKKSQHHALSCQAQTLQHAHIHSIVYVLMCSCRYQAELEALVLEGEVASMVTKRVEARVQEVMASQAVQQSLHERLVRQRKLLEEQVGFLPPMDFGTFCMAVC